MAHNRQLRPALPTLLYFLGKQPDQDERDDLARDRIGF